MEQLDVGSAMEKYLKMVLYAVLLHHTITQMVLIQEIAKK